MTGCRFLSQDDSLTHIEVIVTVRCEYRVTCSGESDNCFFSSAQEVLGPFIDMTGCGFLSHDDSRTHIEVKVNRLISNQTGIGEPQLVNRLILTPAAAWAKPQLVFFFSPLRSCSSTIS
jgi:hypothetical protein